MVYIMCWPNRLIYSFRRVIVVFLVLVSAPLYAAGEPSIEVIPLKSRYHSLASNGDVNIITDVEIRYYNMPSPTPSGDGPSTRFFDEGGNYTRHGQVPSRIPKKSLGEAAKHTAKRAAKGFGWGAGISALFEGLGWLYDEFQDYVTQPLKQTEPNPPPGTEIICTTGATLVCVNASNPQALCSHIMTVHWSHNICEFSHRKGDFAIYTVTSGGGSYAAVYNKFVEGQAPLYQGEPRKLTDEEVGAQVAKSPQAVNDVLNDHQTGAARVNEALAKALNDFRKGLETALGVKPGTNIKPETEEQTAKPKPSESEWPGFCGWATKVCDFIDWFKEPEEPPEKPEIPWSDDEPVIEKKWSSGLGGGSCPAPIKISVSVGRTSANPQFSFEPICQFGTTMRPVIISLATLLALFILAGLRENKNA